MKPEATLEYATLEEAIAAAREMVGQHGTVSIHTAECAITEAEESVCTCAAVELTFGATA
jgi:hypothetical protein